MALDPYLRLAKLSAHSFDELLDGLDVSGAPAWSIGEDLCLVAPTGVRESLDGSVAGSDRYVELGKGGVVAVSHSGVVGSRVVLSGGSVAEVSLHLDTMSVEKRVSRYSAMPHGDSIKRFTREVGELRRGKSSLFPSLLSFEEDSTSCAILLPFLPMYTLGESFFAGIVDAETALSCFLACYDMVRDESRHRKLSGRAQVPYLSIARRRISFWVSRSVNTSFLRSILPRTLRVQGVRCRPISVLFSEVCRHECLAPVYRNDFLTPQWCHGDLIGEDILIDSSVSLHEFVLIDPNPWNRSLFVDQGKMLMSNLVFYDLIYRDFFDLQISDSNETLNLSVVFDSSYDTYLLGAEYISRRLIGAFTSGFENVGWCGAALVVQSGLNALSLTPFHELHHGRHARALAFFAMGVLLIELGLRMVENNACDEFRYE